MSDELVNFSGKLALQQRVLPAYRKPFIDLLASACAGGLSVFAGKPRKNESIKTLASLDKAQWILTHNWHLSHAHSPLFLCWQTGIVKWLEIWQPDVLIIEANPRYLSSRLAIRWMHQRRRPVVGWGLGAPVANGFFASLRTKERKSFLHTLDALIAYSQKGASEYKQLGIAPDRVFAATNAVLPCPTKKAPIREKIFSHLPVILFVGRLQARKRIDTLIHACASLTDSLQPRLFIVGDGPEKIKLEELAQQIYPHTNFLGALYGSDLDAIFDQADLFVLPGTGGLAIQQAMAHALPIIVGEGDGTQDDLVRPDNGWHVVPGDVKSLSRTLKNALSDITRLRQMGETSYRIVSNEINIDMMVKIFTHVLNQVITLKNHK